MWTPAVLVALLCAVSQPISTATTTHQPLPALTTFTPDAHEHTVRTGRGQPATLADVATTLPFPDVPTDLGDRPRPYQDASHALVGQVFDELVSLCERRVKSVTAEAMQELRLQINALSSSQRKIETALVSITSRQDIIEQHLDNLVAEHRDQGESLDVFKGEMRHSIRELSKQYTQSQVLTTVLQGNVSSLHRELYTGLSQTDERLNVGEQRVNASFTRTNQMINDCSAKQEQSQASLTDLNIELFAVQNSVDILENASYSQNRAINNLSSKQIRIAESLNNLTAVNTANEASLRTVIVEQDILKTSVARIQSVADLSAHHALRLSAEQYSLSNQLSAIQDKVQLQPRLLGFQCQSSSQCDQYVPDSTCGADGRCTCAAGLRQTAGSVTRCEQPRLGGSCSSTAQCTVPNAVCTSGLCDCRSGYWNHDNQECRADAGKDETCTYDGDCAATGGTCIDRRCACSSRTVGDYDYRLANGTSCMEGRVEVRPTGGSWGFVCDDEFKAASARVICRSLGFAGGEALCCSKYGGYDYFLMDDVKCTGSESHLRHCPYVGLGEEDCSRSEVLSVRCDLA